MYQPGQVAGVGHDAVVGDVVAGHHPHGRATVETHPGKRGKYIFLKVFLEPYGQLCIWSVGNLEDNGACKQKNFLLHRTSNLPSGQQT